jgi:hypothetical protein
VNYFLSLFKIRSCYVAQVGLKLMCPHISWLSLLIAPPSLAVVWILKEGSGFFLLQKPKGANALLPRLSCNWSSGMHLNLVNQKHPSYALDLGLLVHRGRNHWGFFCSSKSASNDSVYLHTSHKRL